jgi:hypothetical protein
MNAATTATQRPLGLALSQRTALVTMETVRAALGVDAETIWMRIECGQLRWVFDVSAVTNSQPGRLRELRFWAREVIAPETCRELAPEAVVDQVVGVKEREHLRSSEVAHLLLVSDPHVGRLWQRGLLPGLIAGRTLKLRRDGLVTFLRERIVV